MDKLEQKAPHAFLSFLQCKCPQCREGKMFENPMYHPKFMKMKADCEVCGLHFEIEPGFFWGAMYVSYALTVGIAIFLSVLTYYLLNDPEMYVYMTILAVVYLILTPLLFRYGRVVMIWVFSPVKYRGKIG